MDEDRISVVGTVKKLKENNKSRKQARKHVVGLGYSLSYAYRVVRGVYGRKFTRKGIEKEVTKVVKSLKRVEEAKTTLFEFCLVPSVDLGVLAVRYRKVYFTDGEGGLNV